ncbi:MAG: HD domain-containing protein [Deltaproteobacteria bacterium]|nr:HD domain-containing protein [Deltaproteobacteria bacterium]
MGLSLDVLILTIRERAFGDMVGELRRAGIDPRVVHAVSEDEFLEKLVGRFDVIVVGEERGHYLAIRALKHMQARGVDSPLIVVSESIGEERAVSYLKQGAADFLLYDRLGRLGTAILQAVENRRAAARADAHEPPANPREIFRNVIENVRDIVYVFHTKPDRRLVYISPSVRCTGYQVEEFLADPDLCRRIIVPDDRELWDSLLAGRIAPGAPVTLRCQGKSNEPLVFEHRHAEVYDESGNVTAVHGIARETGPRWNRENETRTALIRHKEMFKQAVSSLAAALENRDPEFSGHHRRVARLAAEIAKAMGLPETQVDGIEVAGLVHDVGKIVVPEQCLSKPSALTPAEWNTVMEHPRAGFEILRQVDFPWPVARTVLEHQERLDGSGYPFGLKGDEILLDARIVAVADVVDAITAEKAYRRARSIDEALAEIEAKKSILYDADAVAACVRVCRDKSIDWN